MSEDLTKKLPQSDSEVLALILNRLNSVEQTLAERLYDTRPIWQKVVEDIAQMQQGQEALRTEVHGMGKDLYYRLDVLNKTLMGIQADHRDIDDRVRTLENTHNPPNSQT